jgi:Protein of unknown function (DUF736)
VYFDVVLDDPTFAQPVRCRLSPARDKPGFLLIWERQTRATPASSKSAARTPKGFKEGTRASDALSAA